MYWVMQIPCRASAHSMLNFCIVLAEVMHEAGLAYARLLRSLYEGLEWIIHDLCIGSTRPLNVNHHGRLVIQTGSCPYYSGIMINPYITLARIMHEADETFARMSHGPYTTPAWFIHDLSRDSAGEMQLFCKVIISA
jgi:hypothetical protein